MSYESLSKYFANPNPNVPIEDIWAEIDSFSFEEIYCGESHKDRMTFNIVVPPLDYKGIKTKGFMFSQAMPALLSRFPDLNKIFITCAYTMWTSYSWCDDADVYFACYKNKKREQWYKKKYPYKKDIIFLPLHDEDWTNENRNSPTFNTPKKYDVFMVASAYQFKNIWMFGAALKAYEKKYGRRLKALWAIGNDSIIKKEDGSIDYSNARGDVQREIAKMQEYLPKLEDYIEIHPRIQSSDIQKYFTASKCVCLTSLIEGKNRSLHEAICCNTPVVVFNDHNKFARCGAPIFPKKCFEAAPEFTPESFADTIHKVITNPQNYSPRETYLKTNGRVNTADKIASLVPYFRKNIPGFNGERFHENLFVNMACQLNYQQSYYDFIYDRNTAISGACGIEGMRNLLKFYYSRFGIPFRECENNPIYTIQVKSAKDKITAKKPELIFGLGSKDSDNAKGNKYLKILSNKESDITNITYEPKARSNWHIHHNGGKTLLVIEGEGYLQRLNEPVQKIKKGDIINIEPEIKHWYGASAHSWASFIEIKSSGENCSTEWLEECSDTEYERN